MANERRTTDRSMCPSSRCSLVRRTQPTHACRDPKVYVRAGERAPASVRTIHVPACQAYASRVDSAGTYAGLDFRSIFPGPRLFLKGCSVKGQPKWNQNRKLVSCPAAEQQNFPFLIKRAAQRMGIKSSQLQ